MLIFSGLVHDTVQEEDGLFRDVGDITTGLYAREVCEWRAGLERSITYLDEAFTSVVVIVELLLELAEGELEGHRVPVRE